MLQERLIEFAGSNPLAATLASLAIGMMIGWMIGKLGVRRKSGSSFASDTQLLENARKDFRDIGKKADQIARLSMEISNRARNSEDTARTEYAIGKSVQKRFGPTPEP